MEFKQRPVETLTLTLNCDSDGQGTYVSTFTPKLFVNIKKPVGFYVKQLMYKNGDTGEPTTTVLYVKTADGTLDEAKNYDPATHTATPVRGITPPEAHSYTIYTTLVNKIIGAFYDGTSVCPNTYFPLNEPDIISNPYTFRIDDETEKGSASAHGVLSLVLEFVG